MSVGAVVLERATTEEQEEGSVQLQGTVSGTYSCMQAKEGRERKHCFQSNGRKRTEDAVHDQGLGIFYIK